jgi:hypothetical protein
MLARNVLWRVRLSDRCHSSIGDSPAGLSGGNLIKCGVMSLQAPTPARQVDEGDDRELASIALFAGEYLPRWIL